MSEAKLRIIFVNPHTHHAYFTCLALSRLGTVQILCPPLLFQLWLGQWKRKGIRAGGSLIGWGFATPMALVAFLFYKLKILSEASYCKGLMLAAGLLLKGEERSLLYVYQDYLLPLLRSSEGHSVVVEMIIGTDPAQANYTSTLEALHRASLVLAPSHQILNAGIPKSVPILFAPYGGDKAAYRGNASALPRRDHSAIGVRSLTIAARAHDYRKGIDILLGALARLQQQTVQGSICLRVVICGRVMNQTYLRKIISLNRQASDLSLQIFTGQLSQDSYYSLLQQADLFVMPSRLEGMSLAALEALWMGVPAVLSPHCGVHQFRAGVHGQFTDPNTAETLACILKQILSSPQQLFEWRQQLEQDRGLYSWDSYLQRVEKGVAAMVKKDDPYN